MPVPNFETFGLLRIVDYQSAGSDIDIMIVVSLMIQILHKEMEVAILNNYSVMLVIKIFENSNISS